MQYNFDILDTNTSKWNEIISLSDNYDFHHTSYYHKIDTLFQSKLLVFSYADNFIALPVIIRPIEKTEFFDITSVYGYAGPIYHFSPNFNKVDLIIFFQTKFLEFCNEHKIISVFSRLHPLIEQKTILNGLGMILELNKTVSINLQLTSEEQRKDYRKSLKSELNQLRRKGIVIKEASSQDEINKFIQIYYQTMDRVAASPSYYFSNDYFYDFLNNSDFDSRLLVAIKEGEVIAGAIFTFTKSIMQYHLAGTKDTFIAEAPMKLILDEARLIGNDSVAKTLHLGGGVGGQDTDSLFRFKSAFSKDFKQFSVWKFIVNIDIYNNLSKDKIRTDFFPLYRS